jgi:hypothetical protein
VDRPDRELSAMPSEIRQIIFRAEELIEAIVSYSNASAEPLPAGAVEAVEVVSGKTISVRVHIRGEGNLGDYQTTLDASTVAASLIRYCRDTGIPLPRDSEKSLQVTGDNLALVIKIRSQAVTFSLATLADD